MSDLSKDDSFEEEVQNPYAPAILERVEVEAIHLPPIFWAQVLVACLGFIVLSFFLPGLGVPALICMIAAAIRVPLLRRRLLQGHKPISESTPRPLPGHSFLLFTSWILLLAIGLASVFTFVLICFPTGLLVVTLDYRSDTLFFVALALSGVIALAAFISLFRLSLRMPF